MKMIILMGLPGSGKSTIAEKWFPGYVKVNQDILGNRQACIKKVKQTLESGFNVIIDRCNMTHEQRSYWIQLGLDYDVEAITCIWLQVDPEECFARIVERKNHPTIKNDLSNNDKRSIVYKFASNIDEPFLEEGFTNIVITRN